MFSTCLLVASLSAATQDCHHAEPGFGSFGVAWGPNGGAVRSLVVHDDGHGPALYVGGDFSIAGEVRADSIARFDGTTWEELPGPDGGPITGPGFGIQALAVYDDGSGPALYVAGSFDVSQGLPKNGIVRWDGAAWAPVVAVTTQYGGFYGVTDMVVWDDGGGAALYFAGTFNKVDGQPAASIAKYTAAGVSTLGDGFTGSFARKMVVHDDGGGERLWVAGYNFPSYRNLQVWDGATWTIDDYVFDVFCESLAVHDDGSGPMLYVDASDLGAGRVIRWDGSTWSQVGETVKFFPKSMSTFDDGSGPALYAFGTSYSVPPPEWDVRAARWNGSSWEYLGSGLPRDAYASLVFDDGGGPALFVGGTFTRAGGERVDHLAKWTAGGWSPAYQSQGLTGPSSAMCTFDDGTGEALYADGGWSWDGAEGSVVRWSQGAWERVGGPTDGQVNALCVFDDGQGLALFAGGWFVTIGGATLNGIARWDGLDWVPLAGGLMDGGFPGSVTALHVHDFGAGPRLVVGGEFDAAGGISARNVAVWDGATWSALGPGFDGPVHALATFDGGAGARLYAGGSFLKSGGKNVKNIAVWDGGAWQQTGNANDDVYVLETLDLGGGPRLYAGGKFYNIGGITTQHLAAYDGTDWEGLQQDGEGIAGNVYALASHDLGSGPELFAGGEFQSAGGQPIHSLARWDGGAWYSLGQEPNGPVSALWTHGGALFVGGSFDSFGETASLCVARYALECVCPPVSYCTGKPNSLGCTPAMSTTGTPSLSEGTLRLHVSDVLPNAFGTLMWSLQPNDLPFEGGTLCVQLPIGRTPLQSSGTGATHPDCSGSLHFHWSQGFVARHGLPIGEWYYTQYWSRDPFDAFGSSLSDAIRFYLCP